MAAQTEIELMQYRCSAKFEHAIDAGSIFVRYLLPRYKSKHTKIEQKRLPENAILGFFNVSGHVRVTHTKPRPSTCNHAP